MEENINSIVVFGDGLSDMGKWGSLTDYKYPPEEHGFFESRWTNGKVWVEHFAESLKLPISLENNFAMGGATTGIYNINEPLRSLLQIDNSVPLNGMLAQVQTYLTGKSKLSGNTLYILWAGGHDIGNYLEYGQPDIKKYPPSDNYKQAITLLVEKGAKHIFIGTMPDMGNTPEYFGTDKQTIASQLCVDLNNGLNEIEKSYSDSDVNIYKFDGARVFTEIGMNAKNYDIEHTNEAYLPINIIDFTKPLETSTVRISNKESGKNPDKFMNWWAVSASAKVHQILGNKAFDFYKEQIKNK